MSENKSKIRKQKTEVMGQPQEDFQGLSRKKNEEISIFISATSIFFLHNLMAGIYVLLFR